MKRTLGILLAVAAAATPFAMPSAKAAVPCTDGDDTAKPYTVDVNGETATGHFAVPASQPDTLVVMFHGYGHTTTSWTHHLANAARDHGVAAVAMDYRGTVPGRGWRVKEGAVDSVVAAQDFLASCPGITNVIAFSVSLGSNTAGLAIAAGAQRPSGGNLFDHWINVEGVSNVVETYLSARVLAAADATAAKAKADIEEEMGGPIENDPEGYADLAVVTHGDDIKAAGLKSVVLIHGIDDGLVPPNQSREMAAVLDQQGIPLDFYTVGRRSPSSEKETTISGYVVPRVKPDWISPLAGHASEKSTTHIVMVTALEKLAEVLGGQVPQCHREFHVDGELGTYPTGGTC